VGGLWCALWSTRWRLLGVVPIVAGLMLAPAGRKPDVLVGRGAGSLRCARMPASFRPGRPRLEFRAGALAGA
jgi:competence protein ComEC